MKYANVSANTLFHFTNKKKNLIGILSNEFLPRYCLEEMPFNESNIVEKAIPMVCFCDLPISQIKQHLKFYGRYGLGMRKEWGINKGLNPVFYISKGSQSKKRFQNIIKFLFSDFWPKENFKEHPHISLKEFLSYFKPYEGKIWRNGKYIEKKFYDEREWRYVPKLEDFLNSGHGFRYWLTKDEFLEEKTKKICDEYIGYDLPLKFGPDDIKYIIVSKEKEIDGLIESIEEIKSKYDEKTKKRLFSRIISSEQIIEDF
ncbi:MAG: hypothetical protein GYA35_03980 [Thermoanaerobaculaceae bacterium]|nr:hypothetical protein [Thermoanaerobaculaceae bacterium]